MREFTGWKHRTFSVLGENIKKHRKDISFIALIGVSVLLVAVVIIYEFSKIRITTSQPIKVCTENTVAEVSPYLQKLEPVVLKTSVIINGKKNFLLCTFQNKDQAMQNVKRRDAEFLELMQHKWKLEELSASNWKDYLQDLEPYTDWGLPGDLGGDKYEDQCRETNAFLQIYGNEELNRETIAYINFSNLLLKKGLIQKIPLDYIADKFPFDAPLLQST